MFDSSFTTPCALLWQLGVAHGVGPDGARVAWLNGPFPGAFHFDDDTTLRQTLQDPSRLPPIDMDVLLSAWLNLSSRYPPRGEPALSVGRTPFVAPSRCRAVLAALVRSGHARDVGGRFEWTRRIAAAMERVWLWEPDGTPMDELIEATVERDAAQMLSMVDESLRLTLTAKARATGELEFVTWLRDDMDQLFIDFRPDGTVSPQRGAERIRVLKRIHCKLRATTH